MIEVRIQEGDFDIEALTNSVRNRMSGAIVTFIGTVRDDKISALRYEAYTDMAMKELKKLASEAVERYGLNDAVIVHRTGRLEVGENAVFIGVSAPHRAGAFDGCRYIIDRLKETVPIWKEELK